jgi:hypothetical protein
MQIIAVDIYSSGFRFQLAVEMFSRVLLPTPLPPIMPTRLPDFTLKLMAEYRFPSLEVILDVLPSKRISSAKLALMNFLKMAV